MKVSRVLLTDEVPECFDILMKMVDENHWPMGT